MKNLSELIDHVNVTDIKNYAAKKRAAVTKECKKLTHEFVDGLKRVDLSVVDAKVKKQVLRLFNLPLKTEVDALKKRVLILEKRLNTLKRRA